MLAALPVYICLTLLAHCTTLRAEGIWNVNIDNDPAPPPAAGPPFSAHAIRDPSRLAAEVTGIVVAYVGSVFVIGTLLLTIGRRLRKEALNPFRGPPIEMLKPSRHAFESPVSPSEDQRPWYSPRRLARRVSTSTSMRSESNPGSPGMESLASFDARVLEADKRQRQNELERLYAAVIDHEEHLEQVAATSQVNLNNRCDDEDPDIEKLNRTGEKRLPRLMTNVANRQLPDDHPIHQSPATPISPVSQRSPIRAIYPPDSFMPSIRPSSTTSPIRTEYPRTTPGSGQSHIQPGLRESPMTAVQSSPPGPQAHSARSNEGGHRKRLRRSLKKINVEMMNQLSPGNNEADSANTPLAPRQFADDDFVLTPKSERTSTPSTYRSARSISHGIPEITESYAATPGMPTLSMQRGEWIDKDIYWSGPSAIAPTRISTPKMLIEGKTGAPAHPLPKLKANASNATLGSLPFRAMASHNELASPGLETKTTFLERRNQFSGPRTGVATPYSPYMPFTPLTPVTPRLVSRQERRQIEREKGRRVLAEEDQVIDENEMWA